MDGHLGIEYIYNSGIKIDLIYLDMDHTFESVTGDLEVIYKYFPNVPLIGDDYDFYDGVRFAVTNYITKYNYNIEILGNCYFIYNVNNTNIEYQLYNNLKYNIIEPIINNNMNVLICTIDINNATNIINMYKKTNTKYTVSIIDNNYGYSINSIIKKKYNVIVLLLNKYIIDSNTSYFFNNYPDSPIIFDKPEIFANNRHISFLSISTNDFFKIDGLPNINDLELIQSVIYIRLSKIIVPLNVIKYNFLDNTYISNIKIKIKDSNLFLENSFKNGINSIVSKYINKTKIDDRVFKYFFDIDFPQHNLKFFQQYIYIKLNKINNIKVDFNISNELHIHKKYSDLLDLDVKKLIINNSSYLNNLISFEENIVNALYILDINLKYISDILVFSHIVIPDKTYHDAVKDIFNKKTTNIMDYNDMLNLDKQFDFIFINFVTDFKLQIIIKNLKLNGSAIIAYGFSNDLNYDHFEILCSILSFMFQNTYIFKNYSIMGYRRNAYILIKNKEFNINLSSLTSINDNQFIVDNIYDFYIKSYIFNIVLYQFTSLFIVPMFVEYRNYKKLKLLLYINLTLIS